MGGAERVSGPGPRRKSTLGTRWACSCKCARVGRLLEKAATERRGGTEQKALILDCHNEAESNDVTAAQIAAQIPSDRSTVTIKYAGASGR